MFFDELQDALFGDPAAARSALAGARPIAPLEDVTSRSIIIRAGTPAHGKQRFDETEIDPPRDDSARSTIPRVTAQVYKVPKKSHAGLVVTLLIVAILLTAAFLAGRYLKF